MSNTTTAPVAYHRVNKLSRRIVETSTDKDYLFAAATVMSYSGDYLILSTDEYRQLLADDEARWAKAQAETRAAKAETDRRRRGGPFYPGRAS